MRKKVSIIVPVFNALPYIRSAIQSLLCLETDTYDFQVIAVDDASTDGSDLVLEEFQDHPDVMSGRISYQPCLFSSNTPGGVCCAANYGLSVADGDFVAFLDADDVILPHEFVKAVAALDKGGWDFVLNRCWDFHVSEGERRIHGDDKKLKKVDFAASSLDELKKMLLRVSAVPWRKIYRRDFLERNKLRFVEVNYPYEDNPFHWDVVLAAKSIGSTEFHTHVYRLGHGSQSVSGAGLKFLNMLKHYDNLTSILEKHEQREPFESEMVAWVIDHILWVGEHISAHAQPLLFERGVELLKHYSLETVVSELEEFSESRWVIDRILSVYYRDIRWFMQLK